MMIQTDKSGMLTGFPLHDSKLCALSYANASLELTLDKGGKRYVIYIKNIRCSGFSNFKLDGILSEIFLWKVSDVPQEILQISDGAWSVLFSDVTESSAIQAEIQNVKKRFFECFLVQINFSYGGSFALICDDLSIS